MIHFVPDFAHSAPFAPGYDAPLSDAAPSDAAPSDAALQDSPVARCAATPSLDDALAQLASLRHALHLVETLGGDAPSAVAIEGRLASAWVAAGGAARRCIAQRSEAAAAAAEAGLLALAALADRGAAPGRAALAALAATLRAELSALDAYLPREAGPTALGVAGSAPHSDQLPS